MKDVIIVILSVISIIVSGISLWESDQSRKLSAQTAMEAKDLQEKLNRPWVTLSAINIERAKGFVGIRFTFKNTGLSPAMLMKACPIVSTENDAKTSQEVDEAEKDPSSIMDLPVLSQGQPGAVLMSLGRGSEEFLLVQRGENFRYAVRWSYQGILGTRHKGKQLGIYDSHLRSFTLEGQPTYE